MSRIPLARSPRSSASSGPLRVLVVSRSYPSGLFPTQGLWVQRPTTLLAGDCEVRVVSPVPWCPPLPNYGPLEQYARFRRVPRCETVYGVPVVRPRFPVGPGNSTYALEALAFHRGIVGSVDRLRREWPFDLVHAHFIYPDGVAGAALARRYGVPLIVTEHAPWRPWLDRLGVRRQAIAAARQSSEILAVSTSVAATIRAELGASAPPVSVVPVGVDSELFARAGDGARRAGQILFVGFLNFNKGVDVLLRAMALLRQRGERCRLLLAGGSFYRQTRQQEEAIRRLARELNLDSAVSFLGHLPPEEIARLMRESAVVVLPSRAESFGAVLVEALASGTPVVATRCGGPEDIVDPSVGVLVPPDDPKALAAALAGVLAHPEVYAPEALRRYALERFSWDTIVERILDVYKAVAGIVGEREVRVEPAKDGAALAQRSPPIAQTRERPRESSVPSRGNGCK